MLTPDEHVLETLEKIYLINQSSVTRTAHPPLNKEIFSGKPCKSQTKLLFW